MKKNKFYLLALIPLALSMTSFNIETQIERKSMELGSATPDDAPEDSAEDQPTDQRVDIGQFATHIFDIFKELELSVDTDNNNQADTSLEVVSVEVKEASRNSINTDNQDKVILIIRSNRDYGLEAKSGTNCECDDQQLTRIEMTPNQLGFTADTDIASLDQETLKQALQTNSGVIVEKINQQRMSQHEERLAERDCSSKEDDREQLNCLLDRVKESSGDEKEEFIAQIEEQMIALLYSEEDSDQRIFRDIFKKLKGDRALRDLKAKLDEHKDIKREIDDYKEESQRLADDIKEFDQLYEDSLDTITRIERTGFRSPLDHQHYREALYNQQMVNVMRSRALSQHNTLTTSFRDDFNRITRGSNLSRQHLQIANNYAFPTNTRGRRLGIRERSPLIDPLRSRPLIGDRYTDMTGDNYLYNTPHNRFNNRFIDRSTGRGRVGNNFGTFNNRGTRGRRNLFPTNRYGPDTLPRAARLNINNTYQDQPRRRGRNIMDRGRSRF